MESASRVLKEGQVVYVHMFPVCGTASRAREKPVPAALKQQARQDAQADLPASERQLEDIRHELAQSKQAQLAAEDRLAQLERTAKALELERNQTEISSSNQAVAAEAALERSKDRERALQAQLDVLKTS